MENLEINNRQELKIPDFREFRTPHTIRSFCASEEGVRVTWDDGQEFWHHNIWLRENSPDPETTHPRSRE